MLRVLALLAACLLVSGCAGAYLDTTQRSLDQAEEVARRAAEGYEERKVRLAKDLLCSSSLEELARVYHGQWDSLLDICGLGAGRLTTPSPPAPTE